MSCGKFIVFEGIDGAGTTINSKWLCRYIQNKIGISVFYTHGPTYGPIGRFISENPTVSDRATALLFLSDRIDQEDRIILPKLASGQWVICDRYIWSSLAYQSNWNDIHWLEDINKNYVEPDLVFLLNASIDVARERRMQRDKKIDIRYEKNDFLRRVGKMYMHLYDIGKIPNASLVDADKDLLAVQDKIIDIVDPFLYKIKNENISY